MKTKTKFYQRHADKIECECFVCQHPILTWLISFLIIVTTLLIGIYLFLVGANHAVANFILLLIHDTPVL